MLPETKGILQDSLTADCADSAVRLKGQCVQSPEVAALLLSLENDDSFGLVANGPPGLLPTSSSVPYKCALTHSTYPARLCVFA